MFRKSSFGIAATLLVGVLAMGCSDDDDGGSSDGVMLFTDTYPGLTVQQTSWYGDDSRALSHNGVSASNFEFYAMDGRDVGILTYTTGGNRLFASYWNGSTFTTPVEIVADNYNPGTGLGSIQVLWLNPSATDATFRNGDAIIMFSRQELNNPTTTTVTEGADRLYSSYFDSSEAITGQMGEIKFGFDTVADYVYTTPEINTTPSPTVHLSRTGDYGLVSDSNRYSHDGGDADISGQTTTFAYALWFSQSGGTTNEVRMYSRSFDLSSTNTTNTFTGAQNTHSGQTAGTGENVQSSFAAHNGTVFYTSTQDGAAGGTLLDHINFEAGVTSALASNTETGGALVGAAAITASLPDAGNIYGPDHGLRDVVAIYTESGLGGATGGEDLDVWMNVIDPTVAATANAGVEIDGFRGAPAVAADAAAVSGLDTRIALGSEWIAVGFTQNNLIDNTSTSLVVNPWGTVVQVALAGNAARTAALSASLAVDLSGLAANVGGTAATAVTNGEFQVDLADGEEDPTCNVQSNHLTMNVMFDQTNVSGPATSAIRQLRVNTLTAVLDSAATPAAVPTTTSTSANTVVDSIHETWFGGVGANLAYGWGTNAAVLFDDGAGGPAIAYRHQSFSPDADQDTGPLAGTYISTRMYFWRAAATTPQLISSLAPTNTVEGKQVTGGPSVLQTGITSAVDTNGNDGGSGAHIFWNQNLQTTGGRSALASVFWDKDAAIGTTPPAVGDQFLPVRVTTGDNDPAIIDNDLSETAGLLAEGLFRNGGDNASAYFTQGGNLWWNAFAGTAWRATSGLGDPQLVSHDNHEGVTNNVDVFTRGTTNCFNNASVMNVWERNDSVSGEQRIHARASN